MLSMTGEVGAKWRLGEIPHSWGFLSAICDDFSAISQQPIFTKFGRNTRIRVLSKGIRKDFRNFSALSFAPKYFKTEEVKQASHSDQPRARTAQRYSNVTL